MSLREVKELANGKETLVGYVRAADIKECPVGTLADHIIFTIDIMCEPIFNTIRKVRAAYLPCFVAFRLGCCGVCVSSSTHAHPGLAAAVLLHDYHSVHIYAACCSASVSFQQDLLKLRELGKAGVKQYKPKWRTMRMLKGQSILQEMSSSTHNKDIKTLLEAGEDCLYLWQNTDASAPKTLLIHYNLL
jgi:hypothetical protein